MADEKQNAAATEPAGSAGHDEVAICSSIARSVGARRHTLLYVSVTVNTLAVGAVVAMVFWGPPRAPEIVQLEPSNPTTAPVVKTSDASPKAPVDRQGVSAARAAEAMKAANYLQAMERYAQLRDLARGSEDTAMADFFSLRVAECRRHMGQADAARTVLAVLEDSPSAAVRAWSMYELAVLELGEGQFLRARSKAYSAIAAVRLIKSGPPLEADCEFLVGRALTARSMADTAGLRWPDDQLADRLSDLDEPTLRAAMKEGAGSLAGRCRPPGWRRLSRARRRESRRCGRSRASRPRWRSCWRGCRRSRGSTSNSAPSVRPAGAAP